MSKENSLNKILLKDDNVNYYTKLLILLYIWDYYEDYYIPNRKIMNTLKISKNNVKRLLHQLYDNKVIHIFYKGRKRYFTFIAKKDIDIKQNDTNKDLFDYNWLDEED